MPTRHCEMQARADALKGFYERSLADVLTLREQHRKLMARHRQACLEMRLSSARTFRLQGFKLRCRVHSKILALRSIGKLADRYQSAADLQNEREHQREAAE